MFAVPVITVKCLGGFFNLNFGISQIHLQLCYWWPCFFPLASEKCLMSLGWLKHHLVSTQWDWSQIPLCEFVLYPRWWYRALCSRTHLSSAPCTAHLFSCTYYNCSAYMEMIFWTSWGNTIHFMAEELRELERFCWRSCQKTCDRAGDELESVVSFWGKALSFTLSFFHKVWCCLFTSVQLRTKLLQQHHLTLRPWTWSKKGSYISQGGWVKKEWQWA